MDKTKKNKKPIHKVGHKNKNADLKIPFNIVEIYHLFNIVRNNKLEINSNIKLIGYFDGEDESLRRQVLVNRGKNLSDISISGSNGGNNVLDITLPPDDFQLFVNLMFKKPAKCSFDPQLISTGFQTEILFKKTVLFLP